LNRPPHESSHVIACIFIAVLKLQLIQNNGKKKMRLQNLKGEVRRIFFNYVKKQYVDRQLEVRQGNCMQCGKCCSLVFRCPFLNRENRCTIYHKGRPRHCKTFPLDQRDLHDIGGACGYYFD
jgi:hypothetical protein